MFKDLFSMVETVLLSSIESWVVKYDPTCPLTASPEWHSAECNSLYPAGRRPWHDVDIDDTTNYYR